MDHIKQRLDNELPLTFKEVCYTLLQAIDFYYLFETKAVNMQIGGNDQWINIINGVHLINSIANKPSIGLIVQLLLNSKGKKMGKTEEGAVWADGTMDKYSFWQYFRNLPDEDIKNFLYIFSMDPVVDIDNRLATEDINQSKIYLADTMVKLVYGEDTLNKDEEILSVDSLDLIGLLIDLEFTDNRSEAKRHINSGAIRINGVKVEENMILPKGEEMTVTLGKSKKKKFCIRLTKNI
jgi:tyrosyl-tRNA synthetase